MAAAFPNDRLVPTKVFGFRVKLRVGTPIRSVVSGNFHGLEMIKTNRLNGACLNWRGRIV